MFYILFCWVPAENDRNFQPQRILTKDNRRGAFHVIPSFVQWNLNPVARPTNKNSSETNFKKEKVLKSKKDQFNLFPMAMILSRVRTSLSPSLASNLISSRLNCHVVSAILQLLLKLDISCLLWSWYWTPTILIIYAFLIYKAHIAQYFVLFFFYFIQNKNNIIFWIQLW
jgi:hypothetical protein